MWTPSTTQHNCTTRPATPVSPMASGGGRPVLLPGPEPRAAQTSGLGVHTQPQWYLQPRGLIPVPRPTGPHRPETGSLNIVPLSPGTTFPHTVTKRQATRLSSLRAGNLPSLLPQLSEQLSLKGGLRDSPRYRGRDRGADSL